MTSTTTGTSAVGHAHPQAIRPTLSLASKQEHVLLTNSSEEHSTRRKNQAKTVQDQKENMMLQDLEKSTSSYGGVVQSPTPKTTLKGKVIKTAASIETVPIKQPTSVFIKEEHANLIRQHLDNTDLESFLHSANLSAHDAQIFLKLVEKVLEEEVSKRLQKHSTTTLSETSIPTTTASSSSLQMNTNSTPTSSFAPMKAELITNQPSIQQPNLEDEEIEDKLLTHELKTVNTRLSYVSEELENGGGSNPTESKTNSRLGLASINLDPISISPTTRLPPPTHKMASIRTSIGPVIVAGDSYSSPSPQESEDYRTQEQDEFDRLLDKLSVESSQGRRTSGDRVRTEDSDLLAAASFRDRLTRPRVEIAPQRAAHSKSVIVPQSETSEAPFTPGAFGQQLMNARHNKFSVRHQPKTEFEHLVQDYRYRLSGHNGINDLIKALKNAHIGFFQQEVVELGKELIFLDPTRDCGENSFEV
uniref:Uncharacterized protein n=1 Tax=Ditylenchus dipsaci TaxID=166011 RepID=A0A915EG85_9BILA